MTLFSNQPPLILASQSLARQTLLQQLGLPFTVQPANIDEALYTHHSSAELALTLAIRKAEVVAQQSPYAWVIGSDQVCDCQGTRYHKPLTTENAIEQLSHFSGQQVNFYTAICLMNGYSHQYFQSVEITKVFFRHLTAAQIERYVVLDQPLNCAGSFKIEAHGIRLFQRIESQDPSALIGLPLIRLTDFLETVGYVL